jgi:hypothetical protein
MDFLLINKLDVLKTCEKNIAQESILANNFGERNELASSYKTVVLAGSSNGNFARLSKMVC